MDGDMYEVSKLYIHFLNMIWYEYGEDLRGLSGVQVDLSTSPKCAILSGLSTCILTQFIYFLLLYRYL